MSIARPTEKRKEALEQQKVALIARLRQNLLLKTISLASSVLLYFYVQGERNPTVTRTFVPALVREGLPAGSDIETDGQPNEVRITGPRSVMDGIKDSDVRIVADFKGTPTDQVADVKARTRYEIVGLPPEHREEISYDPAFPIRLSARLFPHRSVLAPIIVHFPNEAPAGFRYGVPAVKPSRARAEGRMDRVDRVDRLVLNAIPDDSGSTIDGDFPVQARDAQNNQIDGLTITPPAAHVTVELIAEPYSKIVSVSPTISDQPLPTYQLTDITVTPNQVRILGRPEDVSRIATLVTDAISVRDQMEEGTIRVGLVVPAHVTVRDMSNRPVKTVQVRLTIRRTATPPAPGSPGASAGRPSSTTGGAGHELP